MLNESSISQARTAILSRNESVAKAFVNRTEDGIFMAAGKEISKSPLDDLEAKWLGYEWLANSKMFNPENVQKQYREQNEVAGKTPEELLTNWMNDRQNKSHTTYTCPVTNNSNITLGGNKGVANDRRDVATYSDRIAKMKIRTCSCGDKLRGKQEICNDCINETFLNNL